MRRVAAIGLAAAAAALVAAVCLSVARAPDRVAKWARNVIANCEAMRDEVAAMQKNLHGRLRMGA
ncbi:hypothetical protein ACIKTA_11915, partial [Hansschlegelia beijingensis]